MYQRSRLLRAAEERDRVQLRTALSNGEDAFTCDGSRRDAFDYLMSNRSLVRGSPQTDCYQKLDHYGDGPLPMRMECMKLLLSHGVNIGQVDRRGWTVLHRAAWYGDLPVVELLLRHGASPSAHEEQGRTASDLAAAKGYNDIAARLDAAGSSLSSLCRRVVRNALGKRIESLINKLPLPKAVKLFVNFGTPYPGWSVHFVPTRPWTDKELRAKEPSCKDLATFITKHASQGFLQRHNLDLSEEKGDGSEAAYGNLVARFQQLYVEKDFRPFTYEEQIWDFRRPRPVDMPDAPTYDSDY